LVQERRESLVRQYVAKWIPAWEITQSLPGAHLQAWNKNAGWRALGA
jgi:hypothetical protein